MISKKHKKTCTTVNYSKNLLILSSTIAECVSISAFASLVAIPVVILSSAVELKICTRTVETKTDKSKKQKKT